MNEEEAASEGRFFALASCLCSAISEKQVLFCKTGLRRLTKSQPKAYFLSSVQGLFQSCWILECFSSIQHVDIAFWNLQHLVVISQLFTTLISVNQLLYSTGLEMRICKDFHLFPLRKRRGISKHNWRRKN